MKDRHLMTVVDEDVAGCPRKHFPEGETFLGAKFGAIFYMK